MLRSQRALMRRKALQVMEMGLRSTTPAPRFGLSILFLGALAVGCGSVPTSEPLDAGNLQARLGDLRAKAEAQPENASAQAALGMAYYLLDRPDEAWSPLEQSLAIDSDQSTLTLVLADVHRRGGRYDMAESLLENAPLRAQSDRVLVSSAQARVARARAASEANSLLSEPRMDEALPEDRVAVFDLASDEAGRASEGLGAAVAFLLAQELADTGAIDVVDRSRQQALVVGAQTSPAPEEKKDAPPLDPVDTTRGLQQRLQLLKDSNGEPFYKGTIDGVSGPGTTGAVKAFQASAGLTADGIAGPKTRSTLEEAVKDGYWVAPPAARASGVSALAKALGARRLIEGRVWRDAASGRVNARTEVHDVVDGAIVATAATEAGDADAFSVPEILAETLMESLFPGWTRSEMAPAESKQDGNQNAWYKSEDADEVEASDEWGDGFKDEFADDGFKSDRSTEDSSVGAADGSKLEALNEFGLGLRAEDRDDWEAASLHYARAVEMDDDLEAARERLDAVAIGGQGFTDRVNRVARSLLRF